MLDEIVFVKNDRRVVEIPKGCEDCSVGSQRDKNADWQCVNGCEWRENHWKYDRMRYYAILTEWKNSDVPDMDKLGLVPEDWIKIRMFRKRLK